MCGIFCTIIYNRNTFLSEIAKKSEFQKNNPQFSEFYKAFRNRGPDNYQELLVEVSPYTVIQFAGCVLWTQGPKPVPQPVFLDNQNVLLWNGDIFSGPLTVVCLGQRVRRDTRHSSRVVRKFFSVRNVYGNRLFQASEESDTKTLYEKLTETSRKGNGIPEVFSAIRGPFSFIYYEKSTKTLYFGRDVIGRHSLLIGFTQRSITLSSVACRKVKEFSEVPAIGIFAYNLEKDGETPMTLYPWSQISESVLDFPYLLPRQSQQNFQTGRAIETNIEPPRRTNKVPLANDVDMWKVRDQENSLGELLGKLTLTDSKSKMQKTMTSLIAKSSIQILVEDLLATLKKAVQSRIEKQPKLCKNCVKIRLRSPDNGEPCSHSKVAILFSGGLDSAVLASLTHACLPQGEAIDLLNVAFEVPAKCSPGGRPTSTVRKSMQTEVCYDTPDRNTGLSTLEELRSIHPGRNWNLVKINVTLEELKKERQNIIGDLIYPLNTVLDDSLGCALWFASRGQGVLHDSNETYTSPARIVISGIGADEQLGGYMRHRTTLKHRGGWEALDKELNYELKRISQRNLGRDDRVVSDHGRQLRMPFLDEDVINYLSFLPPWQRCFPVDSMPPGVGDKLLLRLAAWDLGFRQVANFPKRAMQFGSRIANSKEKGSDVSKRL